MTEKTAQNQALVKTASYASISVAFFLIMSKIIAYCMTASLAVLSTLIDSVMDLLVSAINYVFLRQSLMPPDKKHTFGHGKAEAMGAFIQALILVISGIYLIKKAVQSFYSGNPIHDIQVGVVIMVMAIILTGMLVGFQCYVIRRTNSLAIRSDYAHYVGDILMNTGVIVSMLCVKFLNIFWVDVLFALGVGIYLFKCAIKIFKDSYAILMDAELDRKMIHQIKKIILNDNRILGFHELKTRSAGQKIFIQFHVQFPKEISLEKAHNIAGEIKFKILEKYPMADVLIHTETIKE